MKAVLVQEQKFAGS